MRQLLIFLAIVVATSSATDVLVESPRKTNFGHWGEFENCSEGLLVTGFQLKVEAYRRRPDNTALNAIKLFCGNVIFKSLEEISSSRGPFGRYQKPKYCSTYADGFQLKSQNYQGRNRDDVAAVNFKLICADGAELLGYRDGNGHDYRDSNYTEARFCPTGQGICGIQTQVEYHQGLGDDTALNNVRVKCCHVPVGVVPIEGIPTTPQPPQNLESTTQAVHEEEHETVPVQDITDATTPPDLQTISPEVIEVTTEVVVTDATTEVVDVTPEVVTIDTTELVDVTPEVVTIDTTELVDVTPEVVTIDTTELVDVTPEVVTIDTTELVDVTPVVVTDATTELTPEVVTDATTELVDVTPEVVTDATTEVVDVTPEVVTDATTELVDVTPEVVTIDTTELVDVTPEEVVTDATTEAVDATTELATTAVVDGVFTEAVPEVITELNNDVTPVEISSTPPSDNYKLYYHWLLSQD